MYQIDQATNSQYGTQLDQDIDPNRYDEAFNDDQTNNRESTETKSRHGPWDIDELEMM